MTEQNIKIVHIPSNTVIAEGKLGWNIVHFEGNYYISNRCLKTKGFKLNFIPGFCLYKFFYVWLDFQYDNRIDKFLAWYYFLPNPLLPFIAFRVAVPDQHENLRFELS